MTERHMIAYGLLLLLALAVGAIVWWNVHHSHGRTLARRRKRDGERAQRRRDRD